MQRVNKRWLRRGTAAGITLAVAVFAVSGSASQATSAPAYECDGASPIYLDTSRTFAERAADLVSCMSLRRQALRLEQR